MDPVGTCVCAFSKHVNKWYLKYYVIRNIISAHDAFSFNKHLFSDLEIFSKVLNKNFKVLELYFKVNNF